MYVRLVIEGEGDVSREKVFWGYQRSIPPPQHSYYMVKLEPLKSLFLVFFLFLLVLVDLSVLRGDRVVDL